MRAVFRSGRRLLMVTSTCVLGPGTVNFTTGTLALSSTLMLCNACHKHLSFQEVAGKYTHAMRPLSTAGSVQIKLCFILSEFASNLLAETKTQRVFGHNLVENNLENETPRNGVSKACRSFSNAQLAGDSSPWRAAHSPRDRASEAHACAGCMRATDMH
jgi:hypothetical protein